jgi:phosphoinositide-3-kinase, regulatory subunit 4
MVSAITPSNAAVFPEYVLPNLRYVLQDREISFRCMFAQLIVPIAETASRYLEMRQALKVHGDIGPTSDEYGNLHMEVGTLGSV